MLETADYIIKVDPVIYKRLLAKVEAKMLGPLCSGFKPLFIIGGKVILPKGTG